MFARIAATGLALAALSQAATVTVDPDTQYQEYDGTGASEAFQRSLLLHKLHEPYRTEALDYLFTEKGAGFTILRNGLGSSRFQPFDLMKSIAPKPPASNDSEVSSVSGYIRCMMLTYYHSSISSLCQETISIRSGSPKRLWLVE
jgi:hypothetical protein